MTQHNDWSAMQQSLYHDMQVDSSGAFAARSPLDSLAVAAPGRTRCVNAENPTGGMGAASTAASALGPSRKGSPCIQTVKAGESVTLMDVDGPGVLRHIWMTVTDRTSPTGPRVPALSAPPGETAAPIPAADPAAASTMRMSMFPAVS